VVSWERNGDSLILRAGMGEWYNQPHDKRWDFGEDVQELPLTEWQIELKRVCEDETDDLSHIVVDLLEMFWLVGQDWGFLLRTADSAASRGIQITLVVTDRHLHAAKCLGLEDRLRMVDSVDAAL